MSALDADTFRAVANWFDSHGNSGSHSAALHREAERLDEIAAADRQLGERIVCEINSLIPDYADCLILGDEQLRKLGIRARVLAGGDA